MTNTQITKVCDSLELGYWSLFDAWLLVLGDSLVTTTLLEILSLLVEPLAQ
jgi:hypothetical protein